MLTLRLCLGASVSVLVLVLRVAVLLTTLAEVAVKVEMQQISYWVYTRPQTDYYIAAVSDRFTLSYSALSVNNTAGRTVDDRRRKRETNSSVY